MPEPNTSPAADEPQPKAASAPADPAYGGSYFVAAGAAAEPRPHLTYDLDVDVCIIGGGLAGLSIAAEIAPRGWSVAVLEARRIAWNASSRNAGFVRPGFAQRISTIVTRVGADHARELWTLSQDGVEWVRRAIKDGGMRDVIQSDGWLRISKTDRRTEIADEAELLRTFGADIEVWPADLVRTKVKSDHYFQAIHFPAAFNIHPYNYVLGLAASAEKAGARIFEETAAVSIDPAGVRKRIDTKHGRLRAAHIVFAGNVHLGSLTPHLSRTLIPLYSFAAVTKPLGEKLPAAIEYPGGISDTEFADHHYRILDGDRLIFAGRLGMRDTAQRTGRKLRADLQRRFPQLGPVEIESAFGGAIGITVHGMPQIGEVMPGVWLASGFGGLGLNTTAMAATLIASAIVEHDDRYRLFEPFELVFAGGQAGRVFTTWLSAAQRARESFQSHRAHKNEKWWIENAPRLKKEEEEAAERARIRAEEWAKAEAERIERETIEAAEAEARRIERERIAAEKAEAKRLRAEAKAAARAEAARLKEERRAAARAEKERIAAEKAEARRIEAERLAAAREEAERIAAEQAAIERTEAERVAAEQAAIAQAQAARPDVAQSEAERLEAAYRNAERVAENAARLFAERSKGEPAADVSAASGADDATPPNRPRRHD